jgi:hypothetical protein
VAWRLPDVPHRRLSDSPASDLRSHRVSHSSSERIEVFLMPKIGVARPARTGRKERQKYDGDVDPSDLRNYRAGRDSPDLAA